MKFKVASVLVVALLLGDVESADDLIEPLSKDNSAQCGCYLVGGPDPGYFQYHRFWDFRSMPSDGDNDFSVAPSLVDEDQASGGQLATSAYFASTKWQNEWSFLDGEASPEGPVPNIYSKQNVYISRNTTAGAGNATFLTLRGARLPSFMSTSQITSQQQNLMYASIRTRMRVIPNGLSNSSAPSAGTRLLSDADVGSNSSHPVDGGAVVGFFTFQSDTQEADIEILTLDSTDQIRYTNQPAYDDDAEKAIPGASSQATLPHGLRYTDWIDHRLDWFNGVVRWYVNDLLVLNKTMNAPTEPSALVVNVWGNGGTWSGNMSEGGQVTVAFEYIDMVFNVSGPASGVKSRDLKEKNLDTRDTQLCKVGCLVDGVKVVGFPELAFKSKASRMRVDFAAGLNVLYGLAMATMMMVFVL